MNVDGPSKTTELEATLLVKEEKNLPFSIRIRSLVFSFLVFLCFFVHFCETENRSPCCHIPLTKKNLQAEKREFRTKKGFHDEQHLQHEEPKEKQQYLRDPLPRGYCEFR